MRHADESDLEDCGPIEPFLQASDHLPEPTTSTVPIPSPTTGPTTPPPAMTLTTLPSTQTATAVSAPFPTPSNATVTRRAPHTSRHNKLDRRLLWETSIGEEYVNCTTSSSYSDRAHGIKRVYEFNQTVTPQCGTVVENDNIMLFTTDFCCKSYFLTRIC